MLTLLLLGLVGAKETYPTVTVTAIRYDSARHELSWGELWKDWAVSGSPTTYRFVTLANGKRTIRPIPSFADVIPDRRTIITYSWRESRQNITIYDLVSDRSASYEYRDSLHHGRELVYVGGRVACVAEFLGYPPGEIGSGLYKLLSATVDRSEIKVNGVLVEKIKMNMTSGAPGLVSLSADGKVCAWSATYPHYDRISWKVGGKVHEYMKDTIIEFATLSVSGKYLYILERDDDDRVSAIDTKTEKKVLLKVFPFKTASLYRDSSSDDVAVFSYDTLEVTTLSADGRVKSVFKLYPSETEGGNGRT